jgi:hypothetical protein
MLHKSGYPLWILTFFMLTLFLSACGYTRTSINDPRKLVSLSTAKMQQLKGFQYQINRTGEPAFLDYNETISFRKAEGFYVIPDRVTAKVRVITSLIVAEVNIISIGDKQWETNLVTGAWQRVPAEYAFQPQILLNPETGLQAILEEQLYDLTLLGLDEIEELPGKKLHHIHGLLNGDAAYNLTYGMIDNETLDVDIWVDPESYVIHRVIVIDPMNEGEDEDTVWQIDFWNFDKVIEINPPLEEK